MQKEEPAEKNDQETSVAASEQEKTGKKRKEKSETGRDSQRSAGNGHAAEETEKEDQKMDDRGSDHSHSSCGQYRHETAAARKSAGAGRQLCPDRSNVEQTLDTSGYVSSEVEETVFSPVTAYVSSSVLEEGQPVTAGEKVVEFDTETLEKAAEQARLTKVASAYGYQDTIQKANKNDQDLANANTSIDILNQQIDDQKSYIADIQNEIKNKQNEAASQTAEQTKPINEAIAKLQGDIDKLTASINDTTVSEEEKAKLKEQRDSLYDEPTKKNQELSALTASAGVDTSSQEAKLADAQEQLAKWQADLAEYEGKKSSCEAGQMSGNARAQLSTNQKLESLTASTAAESLEKAKEGITADRTVPATDVQIVDGSPVSEGAALFKISWDDVKVDISVTKYNLESIALGQKADITVAGKSYQGTVSKINRIATKNDSGTPVVPRSILTIRMQSFSWG